VKKGISNIGGVSPASGGKAILFQAILRRGDGAKRKCGPRIWRVPGKGKTSERSRKGRGAEGIGKRQGTTRDPQRGKGGDGGQNEKGK